MHQQWKPTVHPARTAAFLMSTVLAAGIALAVPAGAATPTKTTISNPTLTAGVAATLTAKVLPMPSGGSVAFSADGTALPKCAKRPVSAGKATCTATLTAGTHALTAKYTGVKPDFAGSTGTKNVVVKANIVGSLGSCTTTTGALVAVTYGAWNGPIVRGCDPNPTTGINLLTTAGFTTTGTQHDGPAFICRIGHPLFNGGTQYPTPSEDACINTPPADAYWSYWIALKGHNTWSYSPLGAYSDVPKNGEVEAWTYGSTDISGTTGQPTFTPNQIRAGLPTGSANSDSASRTRSHLAGSSVPSLSKAVHYLTSQLVDGTHYEPFGGGFGDFGLTMDGALALAGAGTADPSLTAIVDFLDQGGKDGSGRDVDDYTGIGTDFASGGAIGKEALTAEVTGHDPRSFGGHDLVAALDALVCTKAIANICAGAGNYRYATSTFSQALGILAQLRAGDADGASAPIAFLEGLQHDSGAFPSVLPGTDSETDSTAMAAMALALVPDDTARIAVAKALAWLASQQEGDGGFPGASGNSVNSAGVSVQALHLDAGRYRDEIAAGEGFLGSEQNTDGGFNVAVGAESNGSDVRASTQATGAIAGMPFGSLLDDLAAKTAAADGADYLVSQLVDGDHYTSTFGTSTFDDQGLTADGLFGLLAAGGHSSSVTAMTDYLRGQVDNYADVNGAFGGPYSGAVAKLALVAEATGGEPHAFGGTDLLKVLRDHICTTTATDGTCTAPGDFVSGFSSISQSLGVLALQASSVASDHLDVDSSPVQRLHQLQCADGGFSSRLLAAGADCTSDVDATGFAVQALSAVAGTGEWLAKAQAYLQHVQKDSGLYPGTAGDNSNSTALAADGLQTMVAGLAAPSVTGDASPATVSDVTADGSPSIAPVVTWQSALVGLRSLSVASGGFGITTNVTADLRSSTQAVAAAAQSILLAASGAVLLSAPTGTAVVIPPTSTPPVTGSPVTGSPTSGGGPVTSSSPAAGGGLAAGGVASSSELGWALVLLVAGGALLYAGRRRIAVAVGRHRPGPRHR